MKRRFGIAKIGILMCIGWGLCAGGWLGLVWVQAPCLVQVELQGRQMDVAEMEPWMKEWNQAGREPRILGITGWRWESPEKNRVSAPDTGRWSEAAVVGVYGRATEGMGFGGRLIAGSWGIGGERTDVCLVSSGLAKGLFGSWDVVGSQVRLGQKRWEIVGVFREAGKRLVVPVEKGTVEWVEIWMDGRGEKRAVAEAMGGGYP